MFLRMFDGERPYLGSFLSGIGNAADQEQSHSDNQQDKPYRELVHSGSPFPLELLVARETRRASTASSADPAGSLGHSLYILG